MDAYRESAILSYIGLPADHEPRPSTSPIEFLRRYLYVLPPHLIDAFSAVTTPKERSAIVGIRNRRFAYTETKPKELAFGEAKGRWPQLWSGRGREGREAAAEERAWAESGFLGGGAQRVGKLGALLAEYEEERAAERAGGRAGDGEEDAGELERRVRELFIYGLLEGAEYERVDWSEQYDDLGEDDPEE